MKLVSPLVFSANLKTIINIPTLPLDIKSSSSIFNSLAKKISGHPEPYKSSFALNNQHEIMIFHTFLSSWFWPWAKSKSLLNFVNFLYLEPAVDVCWTLTFKQYTIYPKNHLKHKYLRCLKMGTKML